MQIKLPATSYQLIPRSGFTLIELVFALAIISTGLFGVTALTFYDFNLNTQINNQIIGANLAREGIEVIRNMRDTSRFKASGINNGFTAGDNPIAGDENAEIALKFDEGTGQWSKQGITPFGDMRFNESLRIYLKSGVYTAWFDPNVPNATTTIFYRGITIKDISCYTTASGSYVISSAASSGGNCPTGTGSNGIAGMEVISRVNWRDGVGGVKEIKVVEQLFDW